MAGCRWAQNRPPYAPRKGLYLLKDCKNTCKRQIRMKIRRVENLIVREESGQKKIRVRNAKCRELRWMSLQCTVQRTVIGEGEENYEKRGIYVQSCLLVRCTP